MSEPKAVVAIAWKLIWTLLVCSVLCSVVRQWAMDGHPVVTDGHPDSAGHSWMGAAHLRLCAVLFVVGLLVRAKHWLATRGAESLRRRRLNSAHSLVGAPDRIGSRSSSGPRRRRARRSD